MTRRWSLRTRFVAAAALCLLPLIGVTLYLLNASLNHSQQQLLNTDFAISDVVSQGLVATLDENQLVLSDLAKDIRVQGMVPDQAQEALNEVRIARPSLSGLFLLDANGTVVTSAGGIDPTPLLPQFASTTDLALNGGEPAISNKVALGEGDFGVIALMQPVLAEADQAAQGKPVGAIGSLLNVERLQGNFVPAAGYSGGGGAMIAVVADNQIIASSSTAEDWSAILTPGLADSAARDAAGGKRTEETYTAANGDHRLAVFAPVAHPSVDWSVIVTTPSPMTYGPNRNLLRGGVIALGAATLLTLIMAVIFGELTARPLRQLTTQASEVARGDATQQMQPVGRGEVAALSNAFREMADRLTAQVRDTEAAREEVALHAERLRELLRRTVRLQEDERRRIASDIHDAVSPLITGALYQARAVQLTSGGSDSLIAVPDASGDGHGQNSAPAIDGLSTVGELLERAMSELHDVIFALRPPDLDDLGVVAAIERYIAQINRSGRLACRLEVVGEAQRLSPEARLGVYRIVQETLHNALRHAQADEALVKMEWLDDVLRVTIRDNGSGFDPEQAANPTSLGLLSMHERAAAIGARLEIASRPGAGTAIMLECSTAIDLVQEAALDSPAADSAAPPDNVDTLPEAATGPRALEREVRSA